MTACDVFPPHLRHSIRPLGSVAGITRRAALRLSRTYRLTVLGDVIGADGRIDLAPVDGSGDQVGHSKSSQSNLLDMYVLLQCPYFSYESVLSFESCISSPKPCLISTQELKDAVSKALLALIASVTKASSGFVSASELLVESSGSALKTFQENLDALFGGPGIPLGTITGDTFNVQTQTRRAPTLLILLSEIAGKAGLGKTQICLQLCATVQVCISYLIAKLERIREHMLSQVPAELGGLGGRAVYLDTEGDFCGERMAEVRS